MVWPKKRGLLQLGTRFYRYINRHSALLTPMIFKPISNMAVVTIKFLVYGSVVAIIIILLIAKGPKEVGITYKYW